MVYKIRFFLPRGFDDPTRSANRIKHMKNKMLKSLIFTAALTSPLGAGAVIPESGRIEFQILRDGKPFGKHVVSFKDDKDLTRVYVDIDMEYKLGPVRLFHYEHRNEEIWKGNAPVSLRSRTDDDGDDYEVSASWGDVLEVEANGKNFEASPALYTTSYWNPVTLKSDKILNTQKGIVEDITVDYKGTEEFRIQEDVLRAEHYVVEAKFPIDVWYDSKTQQWVGLKFQVRGSEIEYKRITPVR